MTSPSAAPAALVDPAAVRRWREQAFTYGMLMPVMGRLPTPLAYAAARLRGRWTAARGRDWVELSLGLRYIRARTEAAWRSVFPQATTQQIEAWSVDRYVTWIEEELEAGWIGQGAWQRFRGLDLVAAREELSRTAGQGLVLVQGHYNNPTLACAALGMASKRPVWMTVSGIYEHEQVHPRLQALFRGKYRGVEPLLNGGRLLHSESPASMRLLYRALERGDIVIVVADLPPEAGSAGVCVPWMGRQRQLAAGAHRLALRTGSRIGCLWLQAPKPGHWSLHVATAAGPATGLAVQEAYGRLSGVMQATPGRWWAAHLLPDTPLCDDQRASGATSTVLEPQP